MKQVLSALIFGGLILGCSWSVVEAQHAGLISGEPERAVGVISGLILVYFGNFLPKQGASECATCDEGRAFRMRRFAGMMLMLGGVLHAFAWIAAPANVMTILAIAAVAIPLTIVLIRAFAQRSFV